MLADDPEDWNDLVDRIRAGDRSAEEALVTVFQSRVHCLLLARTRNVETTRELTQEVILHALHAVRNGKVRRSESLPAYIHGIARHLLAGHRRSVGRTGSEPLPNEDHPRLAATPQGYDDRLDRVREGLRCLSHADREILLMILVDGLSVGAIASRLNLSAEVVRQRKSRAIKRIRDHVHETLNVRRPTR